MDLDAVQRITQLKAQTGAVVLAHYYTPGAVQDLADYVGDSLYLAQVAKELDAQTIVLCGVAFMGESAKLLNPNKRVLMPDLQADCPMAHMAPLDQVERIKREVEDLAVVCYVNSTAELKALSDACVTSANAVEVVAALPQRTILFVPDQNLGRHVARQLPNKRFLFLQGCCPVHDRICAADVEALKQAHPGAPVLAHPECRGEVLALADYVGSTSGMLAYARKSEEAALILCTEEGIAHRLERENPGKTFYFAGERPCCEGMKRNTLETLAACLEQGLGEVEVDAGLRERALVPLDAMFELGAR